MKSWFSPLVMDAPPPPKKKYSGKPSVPVVCEKHEMILALHAKGKTRREIAAIVGLSPMGIWKHLNGKIKCAAPQK